MIAVDRNAKQEDSLSREVFAKRASAQRKMRTRSPVREYPTEAQHYDLTEEARHYDLIEDVYPRLPLVSVIVTNHNYSRYVVAAIESVRGQSYSNIECVIVDDASTDNSSALIVAHLKKIADDRFRYVALSENVGQMGAIKVALASCSGHFVACLDADDFLLPDFMRQHLMAHLNSAHSAGLSASDAIQISADGSIVEGTFFMQRKLRGDEAYPARIVGSHFQNEINGDQFYLKSNEHPSIQYVDRNFLDGWSGVGMSSFVFRRDLLELIMPDDTDSTRICADYYLVIYSHLIAGTLSLGSALSCWRVHRSNYFSSNPVLGGPWRPGVFTPEIHLPMNRSIINHVKRNRAKLAPVLGEELCDSIIGRIEVFRSEEGLEEVEVTVAQPTCEIADAGKPTSRLHRLAHNTLGDGRLYRSLLKIRQFFG
jgi:glycosyltransferase involved in cell wall biosynthesis